MNDMALPSVHDARLPRSYEAAKTSLAECQRIDECKSWSDKAAALASYAKQANDDELLKMATRIKARAVRRSGELLKQIEPGKNRHTNSRGEGDHPSSRGEAAREAGMSPHQSKQAQRVASVPAKDFEEAVEGDTPPTLSQLAQQGIQPRPKPVEPKAPAPETWLQGRDPKAFNRALHFVGALENYAKEIEGWTLENVLPHLTAEQAAEVRSYVSRIDAIHDKIATRI